MLVEFHENRRTVSRGPHCWGHIVGVTRPCTCSITSRVVTHACGCRKLQMKENETWYELELDFGNLVG